MTNLTVVAISIKNNSVHACQFSVLNLGLKFMFALTIKITQNMTA
jgi:hypothetical protein